MHLVGIEPHAEGRAGVGFEKIGVDAVLPAPCLGWVMSAATALRRYGGTRSAGVLGSLPSPLAITARPMPAFASSSPSAPTSAP